jgi:hypothetical protein
MKWKQEWLVGIFIKEKAYGRSKKLALIAVCNKLLKQAFAMAKSGLLWDKVRFLGCLNT